MKMYRLGLWVMAILFSAVLATPSYMMAASKKTSDDSAATDSATPTPKKVSKKGKKSKEVVADQATPTTEKVSKKAKKASSSSSSAKLVDLNTASMSDLMATGFTSEQATKIASGRPWQRKDQLRAKGILTDSEYQAVSGNIIAKQ